MSHGLGLVRGNFLPESECSAPLTLCPPTIYSGEQQKQFAPKSFICEFKISYSSGQENKNKKENNCVVHDAKNKNANNTVVEAFLREMVGRTAIHAVLILVVIAFQNYLVLA